MYCFDNCKLFDLNKPRSLSIFLESVLLISMYEFTYLTLHITFWPRKYDFWAGILLNVLSFYYSGEELIIQINSVPSCCVQKKLNVPLIYELPACLSEGHQSIRFCLSFCFHGVLFDSRCDCSGYLVYCLWPLLSEWRTFMGSAVVCE